MATLSISVAADDDDWITNEVYNDSDYNGTNVFLVGGVSATGPAGHGQGWRFLNVTLTGADTINSASLRMMKSGTQWSQQNNRWTFEDSDNAVGFDGTSNQPGDRAIVASPVADNNDVNETTGTVYDNPRSAGNRTTFGARLASVLARGGWSSGNAVVVVNNSDQDASAVMTTQRKNWHCYESATASSEPTLVIDYTAAAGGGIPSLVGTRFGLAAARGLAG